MIGDSLKKVELSKRLEKASNYAVYGKPILDIGSDHANLPIYLVQEGVVPTAIAGEVVLGPYQYAQSKVTDYGYENSISVRMGDGLEVIDSKEPIGTIFICGMGGSLISKIVDEGLKNNKVSRKTRLVLQPNHGERNVRQFLAEANYEIIEETILKEKGKYYEIIVAESANVSPNYSNIEYEFGPKLLENPSIVFLEKWQAKKLWIENLLDKVKQREDTERINFLKNKINQIEQVIS